MADRFKLRGGNQRIVELESPYVLGVGTRQLDVPIASNITLTNMAATVEEPQAKTGFSTIMLNLVGATQVRFTGYVETQGATGSFVYLTYATSFAGTYSEIGTNVKLVLTSTGQQDTGWIAMVAGAATAETWIRMLGDDGDGSADPVLRQVWAHFR